MIYAFLGVGVLLVMAGVAVALGRHRLLAGRRGEGQRVMSGRETKVVGATLMLAGALVGASAGVAIFGGEPGELVHAVFSVFS